ncbi:histidine kinase [Catellatospora sp. NPDC049609]|uniref:sensor histidine kinase n=1 Tax=Catellatospora sp. NPDC049609 TaxID=3155505 RepID=UPI00342857EE
MPASRPTRTDALLAVGTFCLVAAAVATHGGAAAQLAPGYAFAAWFGALPLLGRSRPVLALLAVAAGIVAYYMLDLAPIGLAVPAAAVLYTAAERGRTRAAAVVAGTLLASSIGIRLAEGDDASIVLGLSLGSEGALMVAVIALGDAVRSRRALRAELARQAAAAAEERRAEAARQVEAERLRIAREVHDTLGHAISVVTLHSAVAEEALDDGASEQVRAALGAIRAAGGGAMAELRATLGTLRREADRREPMPGLDEIPALLDGLARAGLPVALHVSGELSTVPTVVGTTAYRVVQEALTNVLRHARATRAEVAVRVTGALLTLEVVDDGRGVAPAEPGAPGYGLRGMSERIALLGGTVDVGTSALGGFRVHADLPLPGGTA